MQVRRIWGRAPHNALTDLVRFGDSWICVCREGLDHASPGGCLQVLTSSDASDWRSACLLSMPGADLRDPKISVAPDGRLMLSAAAAFDPPIPRRHQSFSWFSGDASRWVGPFEIGEPDFWLWRVTWHKGTAYGVGYRTVAPSGTRLYSSSDGRTFKPVVPALFDQGFPNEATMVFRPDDTALCLLRRDGRPETGQLGISAPPYIRWAWKDLGIRIGGPNMLLLPDGRLVAAIRRYSHRMWTSLNWVDPDSGELREFIELPSAGDNSYAGLVWHDDVLWVSYYSSHEEGTHVYLAKIDVGLP